jgi:hypothetical protein
VLRLAERCRVWRMGVTTVLGRSVWVPLALACFDISDEGGCRWPWAGPLASDAVKVKARAPAGPDARAQEPDIAPTRRNS